MGVQPPPLPARAEFSIMIECTPEIGNCHSLCICGPGLSIRGSRCITNNVLSPNRIKGIRIEKENFLTKRDISECFFFFAHVYYYPFLHGGVFSVVLAGVPGRIPRVLSVPEIASSLKGTVS